MKPIKISIVGAGTFARIFAVLFKQDPLVRRICIAQVLPKRRQVEAALAGATETYAAFEDWRVTATRWQFAYNVGSTRPGQ